MKKILVLLAMLLFCISSFADCSKEEYKATLTLANYTLAQYETLDQDQLGLIINATTDCEKMLLPKIQTLDNTPDDKKTKEQLAEELSFYRDMAKFDTIMESAMYTVIEQLIDSTEEPTHAPSKETRL